MLERANIGHRAALPAPERGGAARKPPLLLEERGERAEPTPLPREAGSHKMEPHAPVLRASARKRAASPDSRRELDRHAAWILDLIAAADGNGARGQDVPAARHSGIAARFFHRITRFRRDVELR
ncbi:MAG: hypothetical protein JO010_02040 [Alphaproteobacteria bacterium]|nr:hypothetical protein [Alphaproteobacteria bacterium]